jgi:hypothetical protein
MKQETQQRGRGAGGLVLWRYDTVPQLVETRADKHAAGKHAAGMRVKIGGVRLKTQLITVGLSTRKISSPRQHQPAYRL